MRRVGLSREEIANTLTHGLGAAASLAAGLVLVVLASVRGDGWQLASAIVFSCALVLLYSASTAYHASVQPLVKRRLKVLDHAAIYVLIAATYTPFMLVSLRGPTGWSLFALIWPLSLAGDRERVVWGKR